MLYIFEHVMQYIIFILILYNNWIVIYNLSEGCFRFCYAAGGRFPKYVALYAAVVA